MPLPSFTKHFHHAAYAALDATRPELSAAGRNVVITGGGSGIGAATAERFAQAGAASVHILGRRPQNLTATANSIKSVHPGTAVFTYVTDVTLKRSVQTTFREIHDRVGELHVLVSNAGYVPTPSAVDDADDEDWWRSFEVNIKGTFLAAQAFLHHRAANAVMIYVSSGLSHVSAGSNKSSYSAAKAGGVRFFAALQVEHPDVRAVSIHPGTIETEALRKSGYIGGKPDDDASLPAGVMVWLASPEADFLKGKYIWANWDVEEMKERAEEIAGSDVLTMKLSGWPFVRN